MQINAFSCESRVCRMSLSYIRIKRTTREISALGLAVNKRAVCEGAWVMQDVGGADMTFAPYRSS